MPYKDPLKRRECQRRYNKRNKEKINNCTKQHTITRKVIAIQTFGGKCKCCGESRYEFLTFDHINQDGGIDRKSGLRGLKWYNYLINTGPSDRFQLLCWNCHMAKDYFGVCPHVCSR